MTSNVFSQTEDTRSKTIERVKHADGDVYYILSQDALNQVVRDILYITQLELQLNNKNVELAHKDNAYRVALVSIQDLKDLVANLEEQRENIKRLYNISDEEVDRLIKETKKIKRKAWLRGLGTGFVVGVGATLLTIILLA